MTARLNIWIKVRYYFIIKEVIRKMKDTIEAFKGLCTGDFFHVSTT